MSSGLIDKKLFCGVLIGMSVGLATALIIVSRPQPGSMRSLRDRAMDAKDRLRFGRKTGSKGQKKQFDKAGRNLMARVERMRTAGY